MIVDIDVGNSRMKWRAQKGGVTLGRGESFAFDSVVMAEIDRLGSPARIRLSNVANDTMARQVEAAAQHWDCALQRAETTEQLAGVVCGYDNPATMGVDRWLALLAAWKAYQGACVVVDAGSAVTVDLLDGSGLHRGGYIVPGLPLMREALLGGTARVRVVDIAETDITPGRTTQQAVGHGSLLMLSALVASAAAQLSESESSIKIVVTGGDGGVLLPLIEGDVCYRQDLVLDGLAVMFP
ncbi:MAG: type III pantothenate kinase [Gammaproteobacteria bacterium]|nr:MAG: type III pantothenate kinase [Gammaproteobacteria bacterium]